MTQIHLNTKVGLRTATYCACLSFWQILIQINYYWTCLKHLNVYFNGRRNSWNPVSTINIIKRNQSDCAVAFFRRPVYIGRGCRKAKQLGLKSFSLDLLFLCVTVSRGFFFLFLFFLLNTDQWHQAECSLHFDKSCKLSVSAWFLRPSWSWIGIQRGNLLNKATFLLSIMVFFDKDPAQVAVSHG